MNGTRNRHLLPIPPFLKRVDFALLRVQNRYIHIYALTCSISNKSTYTTNLAKDLQKVIGRSWALVPSFISWCRIEL